MWFSLPGTPVFFIVMEVPFRLSLSGTSPEEVPKLLWTATGLLLFGTPCVCLICFHYSTYVLNSNVCFLFPRPQSIGSLKAGTNPFSFVSLARMSRGWTITIITDGNSRNHPHSPCPWANEVSSSSFYYISWGNWNTEIKPAELGQRQGRERVVVVTRILVPTSYTVLFPPHDDTSY